MKWQRKYSVGVRRLDDDHRFLFDLVTQFEEGRIQGEGAAKVKNAFDTLWDYAQNHFRREEELMESQGYPGAELHKAHHEALREGLKELRARYNNEDPNALTDLIPFFDAWIRIHILEQDMDYKTYFKEHMSEVDRDQIN